MADDRIVLHWIPVGAGGNGAVTLNARLYERVHAWHDRRPARTLLHTALEIYVDGTHTVVECAWPSPNSDTQSRGVVGEGPVFARWLGRFRPFRYEIRFWKDGLISDRAYATDVTELVADREIVMQARDWVSRVPLSTWGRDDLDVGDMWNSNSVVAYVLAGAGFDVIELASTVAGRAPGLLAGVVAAGRTMDRGRPIRD
ncbi:MAG TPA: hypothetical protein VFS66_06110 [Acidimicrobiia bacterium]|nr:hypothetical protein [Acidimicrobiia bacterium]